MSKESPSYTVHPRRGGRSRQTVRDMVFSLGAIGAAVAVILAITHRSTPDPVREVQTAPVAFELRSMVPWPVVDPTSRLSGWRATSARIEPATALSKGPVLAIGYVTPSGQWFGVKEAGIPAGATAKLWAQQVMSTAGEVSTSTVRSAKDFTYVVYGTGSEQERRALLTALGVRP